MMRRLLHIVFVILMGSAQVIVSLDPFNPYQQNGSCTSSMTACYFELRASATMAMFYNNLFRVIATDNGTLQNYQNPNETFFASDVITADGYPKLVRNIYLIYLTIRHF